VAKSKHRLNGEIIKIVSTPEMRDRLAAQGADVRTTTPAEFGTFMDNEMAKWGKVVKTAGIKAQ